MMNSPQPSTTDPPTPPSTSIPPLNNSSQPEIGFTIIGSVKPFKVAPVDLTLPEWIQHPEVFDANTSNMTSVSEMSGFISTEIMNVMEQQGISGLFPVQKALIPYLTRCLRVSSSIRPGDVCVSAPTGSGKTLAYVIPLVEYLKRKLESKLRALVIVPVGELAMQIQKVFHIYSKDSAVKVFASTGNTSFNKDCEALARSRYDVLISTPGRLVDFILRSTSLDLKSLEVLVLDEADRLCNNDVEKSWLFELDRAIYKEPSRDANIPCTCCTSENINSRISFAFGCACSSMSFQHAMKPVHKWLFSATLSSDPVQLENMDLFHPKLFLAKHTNGNGIHATPSTLKEQIFQIQEARKPLLLWYLLDKLKYRRVLCFTKSLENTHRLTLLLRRISGITSAEFSSQSSPKDRERLLKKFSSGKVDVLVSSDLMARGLDVEDISYVVSYDCPSNHTSYIHRSGRTARAGKCGTTITFVAPNQYKEFKGIVKKAHGVKGQSIESLIEKVDIPEGELQDLMPVYETALKDLGTDVKNEVLHKKRKRSTVKRV